MLSVIVLLTSILSGHVCLDIWPIEGPRVLETGTEAFINLSCSFSHNYSQLNQLDLKWYFQKSAQPFIQWVPSTGRDPQSIGELWNNRLELIYHSNGDHHSQLVRIRRPTIEISGEYECKVSTFHEEKSSKMRLLVFDPGEGPHLMYHTAHEGYVNVSCSANKVFPEPVLHLTWGASVNTAEVSKITARRGQQFDVTVHTMLPPSVIHAETVFTCVMEIPHTKFSLRKSTMYYPGRVQPRASLVSGSAAGQPRHIATTCLLLWAVNLLPILREAY